MDIHRARNRSRLHRNIASLCLKFAKPVTNRATSAVNPINLNPIEEYPLQLFVEFARNANTLSASVVWEAQSSPSSAKKRE